MAYTIVKSNGQVLTTIPDGTINTSSTSLALPGRNYAGYGQYLDTNMVWLTENFANTSPPPNPLQGQLWYNTNANTLYVCPADGTANANAWLALTTTSSGGTTTFGAVNVTGNIKATTITNSGNIETDTLKTTGNIETVDITTDNINIKDIQLLKGDNNALRIQTNNGRIDIGSQNANYCNINTDKEKIAFNKPITDVSVWPFDDYIKIDEKASLITDAIKTVTNLNEFKAKFGTLDQLNRACIGRTYNGDGSWVKSIVSQTHQCEAWPIRRALKIHGGFTQPAFTALISYTNP
jgi:hypothetical protein